MFFYKRLGMCELQDTWITSDKQYGDILLIIDVFWKIPLTAVEWEKTSLKLAEEHRC